MHYRTPRISFLEDASAFLESGLNVERLPTPVFETAELKVADEPTIVVPAVP
jgi:hypothetical protein